MVQKIPKFSKSNFLGYVHAPGFHGCIVVKIENRNHVFDLAVLVASNFPLGIFFDFLYASILGSNSDCQHYE